MIRKSQYPDTNKTMLNFLYEGNNLHIEIISHRYPNIPNKTTFNQQIK